MRLSSQLPPCCATKFEINSTRPGLSGAMTVMTSDACIGPLRNVRALGHNIDSVERLARCHEETISFLPAETQVRANFRQQNHADALAIRREDVHAVIAFTSPACRRPDIAIDVRANAIGA